MRMLLLSFTRLSQFGKFEHAMNHGRSTFLSCNFYALRFFVVVLFERSIAFAKFNCCSEKSVYWRVDVVIRWILRMLRILIFIYELYTLHLKYYFVKGKESECFVQWMEWTEVHQRSILLEATCNFVAFPIIAFSKYFRFEMQHWFHLWTISLSVTMSTIMETWLIRFFLTINFTQKMNISVVIRFMQHIFATCAKCS